MKFNKDYVIFFLLAATILFAWGPISKKLGLAPENNTTAQVAQTTVSTPASTPAPTAVATSQNVPAPAPAVAPATSIMATNGAASVGFNDDIKLPSASLNNTTMQIDFANPNAAFIDKIVMLQYQNAKKTAKVVLDNNFGSSLNPPLQNGTLAVNGSDVWQVKNLISHGRSTEGDSYSVARLIENSTGTQFTLVQTWKINGNYTIDYTITLSNASNQAVNLGTVVVSGGDMQSWNLLTGDTIKGEAHKVDYFSNGEFNSYSVNDDAQDFIVNAPATPVDWLGLSNKYFVIALKSELPFESYVVRAGSRENEYLVSIGAKLPNVIIPATYSVAYNFSYYAGPKINDELTAFAPSAVNMMHLSWGPLDYLARGMLITLSWFHSLCGSYGWSIIMLTLVVRILFFPVTRKANLSMKKMATIQPKIKELREQYKDKPQILNQKTMELYKAEKINPLGGCLPILMQIPVFFALYAALNGAVQLRQVPFLWSADLAGPDTVAVIFGLPINPLVIAMTLLMVLQQVITPTAMEPAQKKMMYLMPIIMLIFLYDLPSGLTLYWTVSQIFSILQMELQRRWDNKNEKAVALTTKK